MNFETLDIRGFGCLRTKVVFAPDKLNLAVADNETGKSTLISALLAAFYGLVDDLRDRRDKRPHRRNVTPWRDPDQFGLELEFTAEERRWRLERNFATGDVHLFDRDTGRDHAAQYHRGRNNYVIGEELIGLPVDEFLKSFYLRQEEILEIRESKGLTHYIQGVATALEGGVSSELAIQRLRDARDSYPFPGSREGLKIENAIKRLTQDRDNCLNEIEILERSRRDIEPETQRLTRIEVDVDRIRAEREEAVRLGDWAEARELKRMIESQERLKSEYQSLALIREELKEFESFPAGKWEQLISISSRVSELSDNLAKYETRLKEEVESPQIRVEAELQKHRDLAGVQEAEARDLETLVAKLADRHERRQQSGAERDQLNEELKSGGFDRDRYTRLTAVLAQLTSDDRKFIEGFRAAYAEAEAQFRELKSKHEWHDREKGLIVARQQKVAGTARLFFLIAAVTIFSGGALILMTQGEWLGQVLAGLGVVFGAIGAITRGTASGGDSAALKRLEGELNETVKAQNDSRLRVEQIGRDLSELAGRLGFNDGAELLSEYFAYDEARDRLEPLNVLEREYARALDDYRETVLQLGRFFHRSGDVPPDPENALGAAKALLGRFREAVRLGEEYRQIKAKRGELETEIGRLKRDIENNRQICEEILRLGGVIELEPLDQAVTAFGAARDKHLQYQKVTKDQLPRIQQELLADVDVTAKRERLELVMKKLASSGAEPEAKHSKEFHRDAAERLARDEARLREEREAINRRIVTAYDRYHTQTPGLKRKVEELDEAILKIETFKSEVETASSILTEISREVYRSWAIALSEEAAPFLEALNPRYGDLKFKEDLSFSVRDVGVNRTIESSEAETVLSTGARDEVFLAARLGVAVYLARGARGPIPIVLDEPLASVDDDKFLSGMKFFMEMLSRKHQVLLMSCHEERHRWLMGRIPDIFGDRIHPIILKSEAA